MSDTALWLAICLCSLSIRYKFHFIAMLTNGIGSNLTLKNVTSVNSVPGIAKM